MRFGLQHFSRAALVAILSLQAVPVVADVGSGRQPMPLSPCETYEVRAGDTLGAIASRVSGPGYRATTLFEANRDVLSSPDLLRAGQRITIPCHPAVVSVPKMEEVDVPPLMVAPMWKANPGDGLVPVLVRWGREAGFDVIVERGGDWRFGVPFHHSGSFRGAVDEVLAGFSNAAVAPYVTFYTNNVMTIGAR